MGQSRIYPEHAGQRQDDATERQFLEDNIATVAFHLGQPGAKLSVRSDKDALMVDPGEVLKEISRRLTAHAQAKPDLEGARLANWLADYSHDLMEDGNLDQEAAEIAKAAQWITDALSPLPSTHCSSPAATIGDIPSEPRPPASAAMGLSAGDDADTLRSALKPFAAVAESDIGQDETDADIFQPMRSGYNREPLITVGDMRRAALVLSSTDREYDPNVAPCDDAEFGMKP